MNAARRPGRSGRQKILVIEDDPVARTDLQARLKAQGYTVALAADAASALTVVNRERPDAILLDLGLPAGDGYLVLERLRKIKTLAAIPVLIITGRSDAETRKRVDAMGLAPVLVKPVDTEVLLAAIRSAVETNVRVTVSHPRPSVPQKHPIPRRPRAAMFAEPPWPITHRDMTTGRRLPARRGDPQERGARHAPPSANCWPGARSAK